MAKNSKDAYGAKSEAKTLHFDPEDLTIVDNVKHALYDERALLPVSSRLVASILHHGRVLQPGEVRKNTETGDIEVVYGRQRVKALIEINKRGEIFRSLSKELQGKRPKDGMRFPALIDRGKDEELMDVMISENEIREDDTPLVRAEKMRRLLGRGKTEAELTVLFGCSTATVKNTLALLDASATVKRAVDSGRIGLNAAYKLARMEPKEQKEKVAALLSEAPATPGKKNRKARKVREIVSGAPTVRIEKDIRKLRNELATTVTIYENDRKISLATLDWVLGEETLGVFYDAPEDKEEEEEETA